MADNNNDKHEIFFDNAKNKNYTQESLLKGILNHTEFKKNMRSIGLDDTYSLDNVDFEPPKGGTRSDVKLTVVRGQRFTHGGRPACYGKLYVNGQYWFDTGERSMVTPGTYTVAFRKDTGCTMTGRADWLKKGKAGDPLRRFAVYSKGYVPLVLGTKGRAGIRIHQGTSVAWSEGCLITGNYDGSKLNNSWECWKKLYNFCYNAKSVTITYKG